MTVLNKNGSRSVNVATWVTRLAFALVFFLNVQCALQFIVAPQDYVFAYELSGVSGVVAVQGIGVAFLMWNVTYPAVIFDPVRFRVLDIVVLIQQLVGLIGESCILMNIPSGHEVLMFSITRFIAFDTIGLVLMTAALLGLRFCIRKAQHRA